MVDYTQVDGIKIKEANLTPTQTNAWNNANKIAAAIVKKLGTLGITTEARVMMLESPQYCFFQTTFTTQTRSDKHETEIAYSEDCYNAPKDNTELLALAKRILRDTVIMMGLNPEVLDDNAK